MDGMFLLSVGWAGQVAGVLVVDGVGVAGGPAQPLLDSLISSSLHRTREKNITW